MFRVVFSGSQLTHF